MTTIRFERDGAIGNIVLANPPFNRLDLRFAEALRIAVHQASESDIRVLVVRSEGPHFSFGGEVREWPGKDVNWFRTFVAEVNVSYRAIEMLKIPTVAVVQGVAFGGGFELALACDFLVAAENATFVAWKSRLQCCRSPEPCSGLRSAPVVLGHRDSPCLASRFPDAKPVSLA
jgi:enoyl-CoA hydratase/carnithine racemase